MKRQAKRKQAVQRAQSENIGRGATPSGREEVLARRIYGVSVVLSAITQAICARTK